MWKELSALVRGRSYEAGERVVDHHAMVILRQQIRDCAVSVAAARKAVAIATAQNEGEIQGHRRLAARIEELETRTVAAIEQGKAELAREAAGTIGMLEAERDASEEAQRSFGVEIERLRRTVAEAAMRLRELQRGQRLAAAADQTQRLREGAPGASLSTLRDAEATLSRLRARQKQIEAANAALDDMDRRDDPAALSRKLAAAGCGAPVRSGADAVLERLAKRASQTAG